MNDDTIEPDLIVGKTVAAVHLDDGEFRVSFTDGTKIVIRPFRDESYDAVLGAVVSPAGVAPGAETGREGSD